MWKERPIDCFTRGIKAQQWNTGMSLTSFNTVMTSWIVCRLMCWPLKLFITSLSIKSYLCPIPPKLRSFNQIKAHATNQWAKIRYLFYLSTDIFYFRLQRLLPWNLSCTQENLWDLWIWKEWCLDSPYVRCVLASRPFHSLNVHFIV